MGRAEARHDFTESMRMLMLENDVDGIERAVNDMRREWRNLRIAFTAAALALVANAIILLLKVG